MALTEFLWFSWFFCLALISLVISYMAASLILAKGNAPDCFNTENWTSGTVLLFLYFESGFAFVIYLQASGQIPSLLDYLN